MTMNELDTARQWVQEADGHVLFLLGAGASKPALPVSSELTVLVLASVDRAVEDFGPNSRVPQLWRGIRPVLEEIGSNVEDVYQAVETLSYQESDPTRYWATGFVDFPEYDRDRKEMARDARWISRMIQGHTLGALNRAQRGAPLDHLELLLRASKTGIVTLNYDQLLEYAGSQFGVRVSTGAEIWDGGFRWRFEPNAVPLLKLHGSMTWRGSRSLNHESGNRVPAIGFYEVGELNEKAPNGLLDPTVIFGSGSKSNPASAFPALTRQFHDWLDESELLVVVGYSFRDQHVDEAIRRWASLSPSRRMIVIDPYPRRDTSETEDVLSGLLSAMDPSWRPEDWKTDSTPANRIRRMVFLVDSVESQLPALLR